MLTDSPAPLPSATVVLLRDGDDGPEVLLVLRHARASFGASYVFPGGVHEPADRGAGPHCDGLDDATASRRLNLPAGGLRYYSAAIRELFEETGILLACRAGDDGAPLMLADNAFEDWRQGVHSGDVQWTDFLARFGLRLACDELHYFAYWVTPRCRPKRFTTRFFAAALPAGQHASHDGAELTDSCWLTPDAALQAARSEDLTLPPPTRATLEELRRFDSTAAVLAWAGECQAAGVNCILPAMLDAGGRTRIVLPGEPDYPPDHEGQEA